jgi:hypothetical protein
LTRPTDRDEPQGIDMDQKRVVAEAGAVVAGLVVAAPFVFASDETDGGHCEYGDFSVNVKPSCDTYGDRDDSPHLAPITRTLSPIGGLGEPAVG